MNTRLSLDDEIDLDTPQASFLAQGDALVAAFVELCQSMRDQPDPDAARQTCKVWLAAMQRAIDEDGRPDPAPALAQVA